MLIRPATQDDQTAITAIIRAAHLNPVNVRWPNFLVAEADGRVAGVGQLRPHRDGSRELASLAVVPEYRGCGIGAQLIRRLMANQPGPLYLMCEHALEPYYARYGFRRVEGRSMPPPLARMHRAGNALARIASLLSRRAMHISAMRWDGSPAD